MFERYTEEARRVIFYSRYEASVFGAPHIEVEHLLLGLIREEKTVVPDAALIRKQIENRSTRGAPVSTSTDMSLSHESRLALAYAAEEARNLETTNIGTRHLFLGILRQEKSFAAELLLAQGLSLTQFRQQIRQPGS